MPDIVVVLALSFWPALPGFAQEPGLSRLTEAQAQAGELIRENALAGAGATQTGRAQPGAAASASAADSPPIQLLLDNPDKPATFEAALRLIGKAQESIRLEAFYLNGEEGLGIAEALAAKARSGVSVQVLLDPVSQRSGGLLAEFFNPGGVNNVVPEQLRRLMGETHVGSDPELPLLDLRDFNLEAPENQSEEPFSLPFHHARALIVDSRWSLFGGTNFDGDRTHDLSAIADDPGLAACLVERFNSQWLLAGGRPMAGGPCLPRLPVRLLTVGAGRREVKPAILENIRAARVGIDLEFYALADLDIFAALIAAHQERGVRVRVLLNHGDYEPNPSNFPAARALHHAGIAVRSYQEIPGGYMHVKLAVFDGQRMMMGSTNWTRSELTYIYNYAFEIWDQGTVAAAQAIFDQDWEERSTPYFLPSSEHGRRDKSPG